MSNDDATATTRRTVLRTVGAAGAAAGLGRPGVAHRGAAATSGGTGATVRDARRLDDREGPGANELLVGVSAGHDLAGAVAPALPAGAEVVRREEALRFVTVRFPDAAADEARRQFAEAVARRPGVKYVEPNATVRALLTPNDPLFGDQYAPQHVNADDAWDITNGSNDVTVAVVDTGVQYDHPDLDANFGSDPGHDFVDGDPDPYPDDLATETHGTVIAGLIAGETHNGTCIAGISESRLLSARVLDEQGFGTVGDVAAGIRWAADQGAEVINLSLGSSTDSSTLQNAVDYAYGQGSLLVATAGNDGPCTDCVSFPAAYDECIAVSAVDENNNLASFSSTGPEIELTAPGATVTSITTTANGTCPVTFSGTSLSTAVVSGVAGLAFDEHGVTNVAMRDHLRSTAVDVGLAPSAQGAGRVDAANAVTALPSPCGNRTDDLALSASLSGNGDADCLTYGWTFADPCRVTVDLDGPAGANFDLYVNEGVAGCPTTSSFTHHSTSLDSDETVTILAPETATDLSVLVHSASGSGSYALTITEEAL